MVVIYRFCPKTIKIHAKDLQNGSPNIPKSNPHETKIKTGTPTNNIEQRKEGQRRIQSPHLQRKYGQHGSNLGPKMEL